MLLMLNYLKYTQTRGHCTAKMSWSARKHITSKVRLQGCDRRKEGGQTMKTDSMQEKKERMNL